MLLRKRPGDEGLDPKSACNLWSTLKPAFLFVEPKPVHSLLVFRQLWSKKRDFTAILSEGTCWLFDMVPRHAGQT